MGSRAAGREKEIKGESIALMENFMPVINKIQWYLRSRNSFNWRPKASGFPAIQIMIYRPLLPSTRCRYIKCHRMPEGRYQSNSIRKLSSWNNKWSSVSCSLRSLRWTISKVGRDSDHHHSQSLNRLYFPFRMRILTGCRYWIRIWCQYHEAWCRFWLGRC